MLIRKNGKYIRVLYKQIMDITLQFCDNKNSTQNCQYFTAEQ